MHPILSHPRRLGLYLAAWTPIVFLLLYLLSSRGALSPTEAPIFAILLCVVYAFVCLSAWYSCRATPVESSGFLQLLATHFLAAMLLSGLWLAFAHGVAYGLSFVQVFRGLNERLRQVSTVLWTIGILLYLLSVGLHYVLLALEHSRQAEQREAAARVLARDAELRALKAQINPHFLFNSLHSISALTSIDAARAREMCISLSDFLRMTLGLGEKTSVPLSEELSLLHKFLVVEKIRFGTRLDMQEQVEPEVLDCIVPPLLLQPLVENAVTHGISALPEGGWIRLNIAQPSPETLHVEVENTFDPDAPARRKSGLGLKIVQQRLEARYGTRAAFAVVRDNSHFRVTMDFPAERTPLS
ncbi:MAG: histidine kinase [Terriglobia bacterium]|nr:histidine kinase [Terriglobia bacterium]